MAKQTILGANVLRILEESGLTRAWLARKAGVTRGAITKIISGETQNPSGEIAKKIAAALGVALPDLYGEDVELSNGAITPFEPLPEFAPDVMKEMRRLDAEQNYQLLLLANTLYQNREELKYQRLLSVVEWVAAEMGESEGLHELQELLRRWEARRGGASPEEPAEHDE